MEIIQQNFLDGKVCTKCGEWKPNTEYHTRKDRKGQLSYRTECKACWNIKVKEWQAANPEKRREIARNWSRANPENGRKTAKEWRDRHPERRRIVTTNTRAHKYGATGSITLDEWQALCAQYGNRCLRCGATDRQLVPDHIISLAIGGSNEISNIQPLCYECNRIKSKRTFDYR